MNKKDIQFLLSGGISNSEPNKSLGGHPSKYFLSDGINNLFDNVTDKQVEEGATDYRCFYIINNTKKTIKNFSMYLHEPLHGCVVDLGFSLHDEMQVLLVEDNPINGWFQLKYRSNLTRKTQQTRRINWVPDIAVMSQRIAAILNSLNGIEVECTGNQNPRGWDFSISFHGHRGEQLLEVVNQKGLTAQVYTGLPGGPINFIAPEIGFSTNVPNGVRFFEVAKAQPHTRQKVLIGTLYPDDFLAVWLRRKTAQGIPPLKQDQLSVILSGNAQNTGYRDKI